MSETVIKSASSGRYEPATMDKKWQARWEADGLHQARDFANQPKHYALNMFPGSKPSSPTAKTGHECVG